MEAESIDFGDGIEAQEVEQVEEAVEQVDEETTDETPEIAEEPKEEKHVISFSDEQQKFINDNIVGKKVAKLREVERHAEELQRRLEELESYKPEGAEPTIPPVPDVWDAEYDAKIQARDEAILARAKWEEGERVKTEQQSYIQRQQEQQKLEELHTKVGTYTERAKTMGISEQELQVAGNAVSQFGVPEPLVDFMLVDEQGPALTMYLAKNLQELQNVNSMNPLQAAVYLATEIKPKVMRNMKRKAPPEPTESVRGSGMPEKERGPKGATFE